MFFIEEGEVTLERMRNLGPGHSSSFAPGPLDQGKYPHMNVCLCARVHVYERMFLCALGCTCFRMCTFLNVSVNQQVDALSPLLNTFTLT
jgi:hypothetical protein